MSTLCTPARARRERATAVAGDYGGVLSRRLLRELDVDRNAQAREVAAGRWRLHGHETVAVHTMALGDVARRWRAIWEVGAAAAVLDGVSALHAAGVRGFDEGAVHVSVPRAVHHAGVPGVRIHRVERRLRELALAGIPRVRPAEAAIRAASWAVSDRQAALVLALVVQQRVVTPGQLLEAASRVSVRSRRALIPLLVADVAAGAQSLGELDFAALCRRHGLPVPDRQVVRTTPTGRIYLDVCWSDVGLVVEIDGSGHRSGLAVMDDNLRQNAVVLQGETVLRIDLVGLRLQPDAFMAQVCRAHALLAARIPGRGSGARCSERRALSTSPGRLT
jgi:very-short-patch-repair endonuclease